MSAVEDAKQKASISDYLAAERTMLAWIRTGLALMGFGFVVARFGIFLQEVQVTQNHSSGGSLGLSLWFGTALIVSGVIVSVAAGFQHLRLVRKLDRGEVTRPHSAFMVVLMALFLACIGIGMTIYLISVRGSNHMGTKTVQEGSMTIMNDSGIIDIRSHHSVDETVNRLRDLLEWKGITLFALVDHSGEAEKVAMIMRPTKLLIFGTPKAGTPVMQAAPTSAIDLPLKILIWENSNGEVLVSYNSPEYLEQRHGIPHELMPNLAAVKVLAEKAAE
jgi:uncharacterized protein (DUF302 family)/uncharacterized membrane protein YidH (DUF202 family)